MFGALLGLGMALMGFATMENVQMLAAVCGHTLIGVVTSGTAGALIAVVLNWGGPSYSLDSPRANLGWNPKFSEALGDAV